jgi:ankyrin repeat protein
MFKKLIDYGPNVRSTDSYGNNCIMRAALDARQFAIKDENHEHIEDLTKVFKLLISSAADVNESNTKRKFVADSYKGQPVSRFFHL